MRYFVEVTGEQALEFEEQGYATVSQGASGGAAHPQWFGDNSEWLLMKSKELREAVDKTD